MVGEKCEHCGDAVLIIKDVGGKKYCLDCFCEWRKNKVLFSDKVTNKKEKIMLSDETRPIQIAHNGDRRCPNCGRIIPFDSVICPYCGKRFETFL